MALSDPRGQFGVHSVCFYNKDTGVPLSYLRVLGECSVSFEAEYSDLEGGSNMYLWDSIVSKINSDISLTAREYDAGTMQLLLGGTLTENSAEATGAVEEFANVKGTSVYNSTAGIASIDVTTGDSGDLKEGKYLLKAKTATTLTLYAMTDVDFKQGEDETFDDDDLIIEDDIDVSSTAQALANWGITITPTTGGATMTINDTAEFYVRKQNSSSLELVFGESGASFTEVGVIIAGQKQSDGSIAYMELYNCRVGGMPLQFAEKAWSEWSVTIKALYDSSKNAVGKFRRTIAA